MRGEAGRVCRHSRIHAYVFGLFGFVLTLSLNGCANLNSIHRSDTLSSNDTTEAHLTLIDAKQRAILSGTRYDPKIASFGSATEALYARFKTFCAEPSPDALSAYAAALSGSGSFQPSAAGAAAIKGLISAAFGEQSGSIGLRTQSITLLRDSMFRTCESYMNRALNEHQVNVLHRRFQSLMVALLGIEQLTGPLAAAQLALKNSAQTGFSGDPVKQAEALQSAYTRLDSLKKDQTAAQTKLEEDNRLLAEAQKKFDDYVTSKGGTVTNDEKTTKETELKLPTLRANKAKSEQALADLKTAVSQQSQVIALLVNSASPSHANIAGDAEYSRSDRQPVPSTDITKVAEAITEIVKSTQLSNFVSDECLAYFGATSASLAHMNTNNSLEEVCERLFEEMSSYYAVQRDLTKATTGVITAEEEVIKARAAGITAILKATATAIEKNNSASAQLGVSVAQALLGIRDPDKPVEGPVIPAVNTVQTKKAELGTNTFFRSVFDQGQGSLYGNSPSILTIPELTIPNVTLPAPNKESRKP